MAVTDSSTYPMPVPISPTPGGTGAGTPAFSPAPEGYTKQFLVLPLEVSDPNPTLEGYDPTQRYNTYELALEDALAEQWETFAIQLVYVRKRA